MVTFASTAEPKNGGEGGNLDRARILWKPCQGASSPRTINPNYNIPEDFILSKTAVITPNPEFWLT